MSYLKSYIFITNSFNVKLEDKGNDVFSITFSDNKGSFYSRFPDIIMQSLTETAYNPHKFLKENSWILKLCKEINDFALYYFEIQENDIQYRFNIITYKKHVIHSRLLHTLYDCEQLSIIEYSDDIVVVRDFSESSTFLNHKGEVLLRTDGLTGWDYNKITPFFRTSDKLSPKDIIISSNLVLCKTGEMWISYTRELQKLSEIPQMLNSRAEGIEDWRCNYLLVRMFRESADPRRTSITDLVCRSLVFYKDGSIVFIDDTSVIDTIHKSTLFDDIYYATYFNNQHVAVFKNGKYLYNIIPSISYDLFDKNDSYAVFYDRTVVNTRFGVLNRKLEYVVPQVLEFARVAFNKHIIYSLDGKYGVWDENFVNVIPAQYDSIECVEKFYLVAKGGGFPNLFWNNCKGSSFGNLSREPFESFIYRQNGDLAWHYGFNNIYPCFKHFIDLTGARHDAKIGICYHIHDDRILYGIINCDGIYIVPPMYDYLKIIEEEEDSQRKHEPKVTIFGISGETKMGVERGVNKYIHSGGQYGLLSLDNKVIIPSLYDGISVYGNYVRTRKGNRFGLCNINGDVLLDVIYTAINFVEVNHKTQVVVFNIGGDFEGDINETDKYYSFGIKGFRTTPFSSSWHPRWEDIHMKITGGMWGYYNLVTKKKSERMYSEVSPFTKGYTCVKFDDKFYLLDLDFQVVDGPFPTKSAAVSYLDDYR